MYEGVHNLHHARTRYGTAEDPEYLPLALMKPWTLPAFLLVSALAPIALLVRYAILTPLSLVVPALRRVIVARYSGLQINPSFQRRPPEGEARRLWHRLEAAASLWSIALIALTATGIIPLKAFVTFLIVASAVAVINQVRTLVAHLWENEGEAMTVTAQYLDSVNVPPPAVLPMLWAPVGLRYHALHHLLPGLPYHGIVAGQRIEPVDLVSRRAPFIIIFAPDQLVAAHDIPPERRFGVRDRARQRARQDHDVIAMALRFERAITLRGRIRQDDDQRDDDAGAE